MRYYSPRLFVKVLKWRSWTVLTSTGSWRSSVSWSRWGDSVSSTLYQLLRLKSTEVPRNKHNVVEKQTWKLLPSRPLYTRSATVNIHTELTEGPSGNMKTSVKYFLSSFIKQKITEVNGKNSVLEIMLEDANRLVKFCLTKEKSLIEGEIFFFHLKPGDSRSLDSFYYSVCFVRVQILVVGDVVCVCVSLCCPFCQTTLLLTWCL